LSISAFSEFFVVPLIYKVFWVVVTMMRVKAFYYLEYNIPSSFWIIFEVLALTSHCKKALPFFFRSSPYFLKVGLSDF